MYFFFKSSIETSEYNLKGVSPYYSVVDRFRIGGGLILEPPLIFRMKGLQCCPPSEWSQDAVPYTARWWPRELLCRENFEREAALNQYCGPFDLRISGSPQRQYYPQNAITIEDEKTPLKSNRSIPALVYNFALLQKDENSLILAKSEFSSSNSMVCNRNDLASPTEHYSPALDMRKLTTSIRSKQIMTPPLEENIGTFNSYAAVSARLHGKIITWTTHNGKNWPPALSPIC